jgi:hypothetical protein
VRAVLGHHDRDRRQLSDLVAPRTPRRDALLVCEHIPAATTALGVMIDDLIDLIFRGQAAPRPLVAGLSTRPAALAVGLRPLLRPGPRLRAPLRARLGRILGRRL